ncbi:MAG: hypothetical protein PHN78_01700 [Dehalococcoidales bacterium]|nr:hypothetical protein [Dehalococcoidales bacterium]
MTLSKWQGLKETESDVIRKTSGIHQREISIIGKLLNAYLVGFEAIGSFTRDKDNDLQYAWLKLVTRSFNSMRCAYILLEQGYYTQALSLLRSVDEDWLMSKDCEKNRLTLDALLNDKGQLGKGDLSFGKMAEREGIKPLWDSGYGHLSLFVHPRPLSLKVLVDPRAKTLRLGASYDWVLFLYCCEVLIRDALRMTEYMVSLLGSRATDWQKQTWPIVQETTSWLDGLRAQYAGGDAPDDNQEGK